MEALGPIIGWLAPILSTIIITAATASINAHIKRHDIMAEERNAKTEAKRKADAEWRESVDKILEEQSEALKAVEQDRADWQEWRAEMVERLDEQNEKTMSVLKSQVTQMRSDCLHRIHRYLDDLGMASTEEKDSFWAEYQEYCELCEQYEIENDFVDELAKRVMALPERKTSKQSKQAALRGFFLRRRK